MTTTHNFTPYLTGKPLVEFQYSYNDTTMFKRVGKTTTSTDITPAQASYLNSLSNDQQMLAAQVFAEAGGR